MSEFEKQDFCLAPEVFLPTALFCGGGLTCLGIVFLANDWIRDICVSGGYTSYCWMGLFLIGLCLVFGGIIYAQVMVYFKKKKVIKEFRAEDKQGKAMPSPPKRETIVTSPEVTNLAHHNSPRPGKGVMNSVFFSHTSRGRRYDYDDVSGFESDTQMRYDIPSIEVDDVEAFRHAHNAGGSRRPERRNDDFQNSYHSDRRYDDFQNAYRSDHVHRPGRGRRSPDEISTISTGSLEDYLTMDAPPYDTNNSFDSDLVAQHHARRGVGASLTCPSMFRAMLINVNR